VVAQCVINTVPNPETALDEFARVLKPAGEIVFFKRVGAEAGARRGTPPARSHLIAITQNKIVSKASGRIVSSILPLSLTDIPRWNERRIWLTTAPNFANETTVGSHESTNHRHLLRPDLPMVLHRPAPFRRSS